MSDNGAQDEVSDKCEGHEIKLEDEKPVEGIFAYLRAYMKNRFNADAVLSGCGVAVYGKRDGEARRLYEGSRDNMPSNLPNIGKGDQVIEQVGLHILAQYSGEGAHSVLYMINPHAGGFDDSAGLRTDRVTITPVDGKPLSETNVDVIRAELAGLN